MIITGASSGIGRAVAQRLAQWEGSLVLSGRSHRRLAETRASVEAQGARATTFACDLTAPDQVQELVAFAETQGPLRAVVLSAGTGQGAPVGEQPIDRWRKIVEDNLLGHYHLTRAALAPMAQRKQGHFVFVNSVAGLRAFPGSSAYVAAKHGLRGFADTLRQEARAYGVKVTSLFPGATDTEWWDKQEGEFRRDLMLKPEQVADAVEFVLSFGGEGVVEELVMRHLSGDF